MLNQFQVFPSNSGWGLRRRVPNCQFMPPEHPRLNMDQAPVVDVYRSVCIGNVHGMDVMSVVLWHPSPYHTRKLLHVLYPHLE
jgi:hypothetical protein